MLQDMDTEVVVDIVSSYRDLISALRRSQSQASCDTWVVCFENILLVAMERKKSVWVDVGNTSDLDMYILWE